MSSVYEDVAFGPMNEGLQGEELEERINKALDLVHMQEKKHEKIYRLSGGEKKERHCDSPFYASRYSII